MSLSKSNKLLWFDCETTGLDPKKHEIIQIAGIIEIDGIIVDQFDLRCAPENPENVESRALEVQGRTLEEVMAWPSSKKMYEQVLAKFDRHIDKLTITDKMLPCGHNVQFDIGFLNSLFRKNYNKFLFSYFMYAPIDTLVMTAICRMLGLANPVDKNGKPINKLDALCDVFNIPRGGHDALGDIRSTRACGMKMIDLITGGRFGQDNADTAKDDGEGSEAPGQQP